MKGSWTSITLAILSAAVGLGGFYWGFEVILSDQDPMILIPLEGVSLTGWCSFLWILYRST